MKSVRQKIGCRIREIRENMHISQEDLGFRAGLHRTYIGSVERGERNLSIDAIEKIAKGLRVKIKSIFEDM